RARLQVEAAVGAVGDDLLAAVRRMAGESLTIEALEQGSFRFVAENVPENFAQVRQQFMAAVQAEQAVPSHLGRDLAGVRAGEFNVSGADFRFADLAELQARGGMLNRTRLGFADLSRARLEGASLMEADLTGAVAEGVVPRDATLRGATLQTARLSRANLAGADFSGADLRGADLSGANVHGLGFRTADQVDAIFRNAIFDDATR